jgi:predicted O-methyltransferase YrrM
MNPVLREILATDRVTAPDGSALPLHSGLAPKACEIIQGWIGEHRPRRLLEIGLAYGVSALFICDAIAGWQDADYHIIDPLQTSLWQSVGRLNLDRAGFAGRYRLHEVPSELCLPRLLEQGQTFQFALIDGMHTFDHALVDFFYVNRMLEVGGIVVFDDANLPSIRTLVAHIATYDCYEELPFPHAFRIQARALKLVKAPFRLAAFRKIAADDRPWDWHREFQ